MKRIPPVSAESSTDFQELSDHSTELSEPSQDKNAKAIEALAKLIRSEDFKTLDEKERELVEEALGSQSISSLMEDDQDWALKNLPENSPSDYDPPTRPLTFSLAPNPLFESKNIQLRSFIDSDSEVSAPIFASSTYVKNESPEISLSTYNAIVRCFAYAPWLQNIFKGRLPWASTTPVTKQGDAQLGHYYLERYTAGANNINLLWYPALFGMLVNDLIKYAVAVDDRYGNRWQDILLGLTVPNPETISVHWGSDNPGDVKFWLALSILLSTTLLSGTYFLGGSCKGQRAKIVHERMVAYNSITELDNATFELLSLRNPNAFDMELIFNRLMQTIVSGKNFLLKLHAVNKLAAVADSFSSIELEDLIEERQGQYSTDALITTIIQNKRSAWHYLSEQTHTKNHWLLSQYTHYRLWSIGGKTHPGRQFLYWIFLAWIYYAKIRFWMLVVNKIINTNTYLNFKKQCDALGKIFFYSLQRDANVCAICPDWPFVPYLKTDDAQYCLDALLKQNFSPEKLASYLPRLANQTDISCVNLSSHDWGDWTETEMHLMLTKLEQILVPGFKVLDMSRQTPRTHYPPDDKLLIIAEFITRAPPRLLNINNQGYGGNELRNLFPSFINNETQVIKLSGTVLGNIGAQNLAISISSTGSKITKVYITDNGIGNTGLISLSEILKQNTTIKTLDLSSNRFSEAGIWSLMQAWEFSHLDTLILDNNPLSFNATETIFNALPTKNHIKLSLRNCDLDNLSLRNHGKVLSSLCALDISENLIHDLGFSELLPYLPRSILAELRMEDARISADNWEVFGTIVPDTNIQILDLTDCDLQDVPDIFFGGILQSNIHTLYLGGASIGVDEMESFIRALNAYPPKNLKLLSINDNDLSSTQGTIFIDAIANSSVTHLNMANNDFDDSVIERIGYYLPEWQLQSLDISHNVITNLDPLAVNLADLHFESINAASNHITGEGIDLLVQSSVAPLSHAEFDRLKDRTIPPGLKRVLHRAKPVSSLQYLDIFENSIDLPSTVRMQRVAGVAGIKTNLNQDNVQTSTGFRNQAFLTSLTSLPAYFLLSIIDFFAEAFAEHPIATIGLILLLAYFIFRLIGGVARTANNRFRLHHPLPEKNLQALDIQPSSISHSSKNLTEIEHAITVHPY